jgi:hypothetical protein
MSSPFYYVGQVVNVDAGKLGIGMEGESFDVTVRMIYGQWEVDGPTMLSVIDKEYYGREHDVSADDLKAATIA